MYDLCMFDSMSIAGRRRVFLEYALEYVQRLPVSGIADRVNTDLESGFHCRRIQFLVEAVLIATDAAMARHIGVVVEQTRAT